MLSIQEEFSLGKELSQARGNSAERACTNAERENRKAGDTVMIHFARRMKHMNRSEIREILKVTEDPEIISFAGGLPAPEAFPVAELREAASLALETAGTKALQYSLAEGLPSLRRKIAERSCTLWDANARMEDVQIVNGSQQALDFLGKIFLDEGDVVLCENPTYLAALSAFRAYGPRLAPVATDDEGMLPDDLEKKLAAEKQARFIYVIPDFQNPTGRSWSLERRKALTDLADRFGVPVVEDNPYGELRFEGEFLPSLRALGNPDLTVSLGTFSKILAPGLRVAWLIAPPAILEQIILAKQAADLQPSTISQMQIDTYLERFDVNAQIARIRALYRARRNCMAEAIRETMGNTVSFPFPQGGLFLWLRLTEGIDTKALLAESIARKVAYVPGEPFHANGGGGNTMRLNFSYMPEERIREGITRLAGLIKEH